MNRIVFISLLLISIITLRSQTISQGRVLEGLTMKSQIMDKEVRYSVYLPPDYESSIRYYPVVYLLHGYTDDESGWIQFGEVKHLVDNAIDGAEIPPMIIIMPDGGVSYYINSYDRQMLFEDMFIQEMIPFIEKTYRIRSQKEYRGISGLSMGGYGSIVLSLRHPDLFAACAAFSGAIRTDEEMAGLPQEMYDLMFGPVYGRVLKGPERMTTTWLGNSPFHLIENDPESAKQVRLYIDCGDDDYLTTGNAMLHVLLCQKQISHEFRMRDGDHNWTYWRTGLVEGLKFIGHSFHR